MKDYKFILDRLKRMNLLEIDSDEISNEIKNIPRKIFDSVDLLEGCTLYRIRTNPPKHMNQKDVSYLNQSHNLSYKRASTPNQSMFYAWISKSFKNVQYSEILENIELQNFIIDNPKINSQVVAIGEWRITNKIKLASMLSKKDVEIILSTKKDSVQYNRNNPLGQDVNKNKLNEYLIHQFRKKRVNRNSYFRISAILTSDLLLKDYCGVIYSNVRDKRSGCKVAINPNRISSCLELDNIKTCYLERLGNTIKIKTVNYED